MGEGAAATCSASARVGVQLRLIVDKYILHIITLIALGQFCRHTDTFLGQQCSDSIYKYNSTDTVGKRREGEGGHDTLQVC